MEARNIRLNFFLFFIIEHHVPSQRKQQYTNTEEELDQFEKHVQYFMEHADERVAMQLQFAKLGRMGKAGNTNIHLLPRYGNN